MANVIEILVTGRNLTKPAFDEAARNGRQIGQQVGDEFTKGVGDKVKQDLPPAVEDPLEESGRKGGEKSGKAAGGSFLANASPLLLGAFAAAATTGPGLILGALATAVVGAGALVQKNNVQVAAGAAKLAGDASSAIQKATAPLVPALAQSLQILDQGVAKAEPELKNLFAAAAPFATQLASGISQLAQNALPGMVEGLRAAAPYSSGLAADFGKLGTGVSQFFSGLATGARGGMIGLDTLITDAEHLLGDLGQITGALSQGLGPALHDVSDAALPLADGLTKVISAFPPNDIRVAADATVALFAAFKLATLAGVVAEGTTFIGFLKAAAAGEIALTGETGVLTTAMSAMGTAAEAAAGPLGLLVGGLAMASTGSSTTTLAFSDMQGKAYSAVPALDTLTKMLHDAAGGGKDAQGSIDNMAGSLRQASSQGANTSAAVSQLDQGLAKLYQSDPAGATREYADVVKQLGLNTQQAAAAFPKYADAAGLTAKASYDAQAAAQGLSAANSTAAIQVQELTQSVIGQQQKLSQAAGTTGVNTIAALSFIGAQETLNSKVADAVGEYSLATGAANAFKSAQDALYGKYASYSQAEATFTTDMTNAATQLKAGKDAINLNSAAGAANFTVLNQLAQANEQVAEALIKQGGSADQANRALQDGAVKIDALAKSAGFSATQIAQLNQDLYGTASIKDIQVTVGADTSGALAAVHDTVRYIDGQSAYIQVYASSANLGGGKALLATGGISGGIGAAAGGGPRGSLTWVGEQGPELVRLPVGATVHSNPDSMRMAAQPAPGDSASAAIQVSFSGGLDSAFATAFMLLVREGKIQIRQKAIVP